MAGEVIGKNLPDGATFGSSVTKKISFFGVTPVVQQTGTILATGSLAGAVTALNLIKVALDNLGLTAT